VVNEEERHNRRTTVQALSASLLGCYSFYHGRRISKDGIQYRLEGFCAAAGISITCHQLWHTFARRLADQRMPIESIAKLLGHVFVTTTQRYTLAANPDLRAAFQAAMARIESCQTVLEPELPFTHESRPRQQPEPADAAKLAKALGRFANLPEWLAGELCLYARQRWYGWKPHMATRYINRLASQQCNIWSWLLAHCELRDYNGRLLADEAVREQLARWGQLCGVKVTPHQLRHTFATQLVNHGLPIDSVRKLLGHQTLNMTQHYARMFDATIRSGRSMSASALKEGAGARSQVTNLVTWVVTIITLLFLTPLFAPLPEAGVYRRLTANWHAPGRARARYPQCDGAGHGAAQCGAAFAAIL
jgi:hypothetical protein